MKKDHEEKTALLDIEVEAESGLLTVAPPVQTRHHSAAAPPLLLTVWKPSQLTPSPIFVSGVVARATLLRRLFAHRPASSARRNHVAEPQSARQDQDRLPCRSGRNDLHRRLRGPRHGHQAGPLGWERPMVQHLGTVPVVLLHSRARLTIAQCYFSIPALVYLAMVPIWERSQKFANLYAFIAVDFVFCVRSLPCRAQRFLTRPRYSGSLRGRPWSRGLATA
jgi:hypothetical protein